MPSRYFIAFVSLLLGCVAPEPRVAPPQADLAIINVGIVDAQANRVVPDQTVLIRAGRISRVGPAAETRFLGRPRRIDGRGKMELTTLHLAGIHSAAKPET